MLPMRIILTTGLLVGIAALAEMGYLRSEDAGATTTASSPRLEVSAQHSRRQLAQVTAQVPVSARHPTGLVVCPNETLGVEDSTYPPLGFQLPEQQASAVAFQLFITLYMFLGLAIVCDSFFEASLSAVCEAMSLKDDVAGATWMAAGGSAPELATSVLGVFVTVSDVGFGTIVGSAVFNVLFVIACCAFAQPNLKLTWWPLARDAAYYCFSLAMIVIFVSDDLQIAVWEATILLLMYVGYVTIMYFNERLEAWVTKRVKANEDGAGASGVRSMLIKGFDNPIFATVLYLIIASNSVVVLIEMVDDTSRSYERLWCVCGEHKNISSLPTSGYFYANIAFNIVFIVEMLVKFFAYGFFGYWKVPLNCFDGSLVFLIVVEFILTFGASADGIGIGIARVLRLLKFIRFARLLRLLRCLRFFIKKSPESAVKVVPEGAKAETPFKGDGTVVKPGEQEEGEEEEEDDDPYNPIDIPEGWIGRFFWFVGLPLGVLMWLTIPDCRRFGSKTWFLTFIMCILWIGGLSFIMVWMVTEFGKIYMIRDSIMGITLLAAGTSIPDCLSSVAVARRGHGDMAVSSSIGSNIFDVLIGLPFPWFLYTAILRPANGPSFGPQWVEIKSESLAIMILALFVMVALVITTIHISGWILSVRLGIMMMVLYFCFLALSLLLEFEVIYPPCEDGPPSNAAFYNQAISL